MSIGSVAVGKARVSYAQSFALWLQATIEFTCHDHSIIACLCHIYIYLLFFAHVPFVVNHTINAAPTKRLQQHPLHSFLHEQHRSHVLFVKASHSTTSTSWSQHHFVAIGKAQAAYAQSFALWQHATIEFTCHDHSIIACSRHVYVVLFFTHIQFVVSHTINATPMERLQQWFAKTR